MVNGVYLRDISSTIFKLTVTTYIFAKLVHALLKEQSNKLNQDRLYLQASLCH